MIIERRRICFLLFVLMFLAICGAQPRPTESPVDPFVLDLSPSFSVMLVLFLLTVVGCVVLIYLQYCCTYALASGDDGHRRRGDGLDSTAIESLPIVAYVSVKELKIEECAVCLAEFEDRDSIRLLPKCDHAFHQNCIDAWLASRATCPVCRADLKPRRRIARGSADSRPESRNREQVVVEIDEEETGRIRIGGVGKLPRSHSTGHSLAGDGALRLPEDVRAKLKRSASDDVVFRVS